MYEFAGIFGLDNNCDLALENKFLKLLSYSGDYQYSVFSRKVNFKLYSRILVENCYAKLNSTHYFLIGEAYTNKSGRLEFCTVSEIAGLINQEENFLNSINGNYKVVEFNEVSYECKIYSSRLSIVSLYYYRKNNTIVISTNLSQIAEIIGDGYQYDSVSIVEQQLFFFPFYGNTIIEGVKRVQPSRIIKINSSGEQINKYFDYTDYYSLEKKENNEGQFIEKFNEITNGLAREGEKVNVALTGGFDSRTIFGILNNREDLEMQSYAFGLKSSRNVSIPLRISRKLGFNFEPIYLDEEYEKNFKYWFELCAVLSDGYMAERTNYPFAYERLRKFSGISINGNWGSEAIRPMQNFTSLITNLFYDSINAKDPEKYLNEYFKSNYDRMYVNKSVLIKYKDIIIDRFKEWRLQSSEFPIIKQLHMYMYFENEPKYFANETQTERIFCTNRYPYYDDDILRVLFSSSFSGLTKEAFKRSFHSIYDSQKVYYSILSKYAPELLRFTTDHGYSPSVFGSPSGKFVLSAGKAFKEIRNKLKMSKEFNNHRLANEIYSKKARHFFDTDNKANQIFSRNIISINYDTLGSNEIFKVDNAFSILFWENLLGTNTDYTIKGINVG